MIVTCSECQVKLKVDETKIKEGGSKLKCPKCQNVFAVYRPGDEPAAAAPAPPAPAPPRPAPEPPKPAPVPKPPVVKWALNKNKIVVADDGDALLKMIDKMLTEAGYTVITAREGVDAMVAIEKEKPFMAILDVALPRIYGFEICDRIKNNEESKDMKVLLIASIFDKTAYKREPTSLYGADDYIEKHHIPDYLVKKVHRLADNGHGVEREERAFANEPHPQTPARKEQAEEMRKDEIKEFPAPSPVDPQQVEAARRFARIILSDIALYNQNAVEEGIKNDTFYESLEAELREGRDLYNGRVPEDVRSSMDYFKDECEKFIEKKRQTMQLGG